MGKKPQAAAESADHIWETLTVPPGRAEGATMSILLSTALLLAIISSCVALLLGTNRLTEIVQRRMTAAELVRSAEALVKAHAPQAH